MHSHPEEEREFQLCRELEPKRLEADMAVRMWELELKARTSQVVTNVLLSSAVGLDVGKTILLVSVFHASDI